MTRFRIILLTACMAAGCQNTGKKSDAPPMPAPEPLACAGASYYHDSLAGNATASGAPYDPALLTAAHRTLPFGTQLRVVREGRGEVIVTINDRGPFIDGRIIDLSRAAAEQLDLITDGVAQVCVFGVE